MADAVGIVEVAGLVAALEVADVMCDAAAVALAGVSYVSPDAVAVVARGEVAAVGAAVDAGAAAATARGGLRAARVLPSLDPQVAALLPTLAGHRPGGRRSWRPERGGAERSARPARPAHPGVEAPADG